MKKIILLLMMFALASCSSDDTVKGYVYDTKNKPIEGVKVMVNSSDIYTLTNFEGFFEIDPKGVSDELLIHKEGYQLQFVNLIEIEKDDKIILEKN